MLSFEETFARLRAGMSITRYGDGELRLMEGVGEIFMIIITIINAASIHIETRFFGNFSFARSIFRQSKNAPRRLPPRKFHQKREKRSVAKMKVQVVTINSVQKSSKSELSSGTFGHVKVWQKNVKKRYVLSVSTFFFLCTKCFNRYLFMY